jgi:hypothetical protein
VSETSTDELLHLRAIDLRRRELIGASDSASTSLTQDAVIAACDLITWVDRLREMGGYKAKEYKDGVPNRSNIAHVEIGARWARNRIAHGDAGLLRLVHSEDVDDSFNSRDILMDDPEVGFNGELNSPTVRFARVHSPVKNDKQSDLRRYYNECVADRRVIVVAGLLAGGRTLGGTV